MSFKVTKHIDIMKENLSTHKNNTLLLRLILSLVVFYSHFFAISALPEPKIPFGIHSLGWYAVNMFFLISGMLISQSYQYRNFLSYSQARVLRVMPAYIAAIILTILFALFSIDNFNIGKNQIIESFSVFFSNLLPVFLFKGAINGSWVSTAIPGALNSSLWTISFEILCYFFIIPLFLDKKIKLIIKIIMSIFFIYLISNSDVFLNSGIRYDLLRVFGYFLLGIGFYELISKNKLTKNIFIGFSFIFFCEPYFKELLINFVLILSTLFIGLYLNRYVEFKNDYSYSIYLFAWPISQAVISFFDSTVYIELFIAFIFLSTTSLVSWYLIEKPFLKMKDSSFFITSMLSIFKK